MKVSVVRQSSPRCPSIVCQHFQTTPPLKPRSRLFSYFTYSIYRSRECIIVFLFRSDKNCGCYGNLLFPWVYDGKRGIDHFFFLIVDICIFLQKCLFSSSLRFIRLLSKSVNLIGCRGGKKGDDFLKMFKNILLRYQKMDETWHTCLGHWLLCKLCFFIFVR